MTTTPKFDSIEKERQLKAESESWDTTVVHDAEDGDIPIIDVSDYFVSGDKSALESVARQLKAACEETGFFTLTGHGIPTALMDATFEQNRQFHAMDTDDKRMMLMDRADWPVGGVGYLPLKNRKLPSRDKGNINEAFIIKCDNVLGMDDNQWPEKNLLPEFRDTVQSYAKSIRLLALRMLPIYAVALDMPEDFFSDGFDKPLYRLRMSHYPPVEGQGSEFGIAPHVDTSFCTILAQDQPGLSIFSERRQCWVNAPAIKHAFIVNSGELLKQWTNDRFISVKHFANNNTGKTSRYSIPFFFNANPTYKMTCVPSCCGPDNPPKYPPISYAESQGVVQGE